MRMPIVAVELGGGLLFFDDLASASAYMEPVDVLSGEYTAFDSTGRPIDLVVEKQSPDGIPRFQVGRGPIQVTRLRETRAELRTEVLMGHLVNGLRLLNTEVPADATLLDLVRLSRDLWGAS